MLHWCGRSQTFCERYLHRLNYKEKLTQLFIIYHIQTTEKKINNSDYAEADLIALNAEEDDDILYTGQWLTGRK